VTGNALSPAPAGKWRWRDAGLWVAIVLAVPLAMVVEGLGVLMVENSATWGELAVLSLFAVPLLTGWGAIALSLSGRPPRLRWAVAALLLLGPPLILAGLWNA
jgi:hypothetical protein